MLCKLVGAYGKKNYLKFWKMKNLARWEEGLRFWPGAMVWVSLQMTKPDTFIDPKVIMGIITGVQCGDGPNRLLRFNFSLSSYHSHLLYFVSTSLLTLTLYVNTFYLSFIALATNYSSSINVHVRPPPFHLSIFHLSHVVIST
jgi:hypothetical protein